MSVLLFTHLVPRSPSIYSTFRWFSPLVLLSAFPACLYSVQVHRCSPVMFSHCPADWMSSIFRLTPAPSSCLPCALLLAHHVLLLTHLVLLSAYPILLPSRPALYRQPTPTRRPSIPSSNPVPMSTHPVPLSTHHALLFVSTVQLSTRPVLLSDILSCPVLSYPSPTGPTPSRHPPATALRPTAPCSRHCSDTTGVDRSVPTQALSTGRECLSWIGVRVGGKLSPPAAGHCYRDRNSTRF